MAVRPGAAGRVLARASPPLPADLDGSAVRATPRRPCSPPDGLGEAPRPRAVVGGGPTACPLAVAGGVAGAGARTPGAAGRPPPATEPGDVSLGRHAVVRERVTEAAAAVAGDVV